MNESVVPVLVWLDCPKCDQSTRHEIVGEHVVKTDLWDEVGEIFEERFRILKCRGCDAVSFEHFWEHWEMFEEKTSKSERLPTVPRHAENSALHGLLPKPVARAYEDTVKALNARADALATLGVRVVVEAFCRDQKVPGADLNQRINALAEKGVISHVHKDFLHQCRLLGNDVAHELLVPPESELVGAIRQVEVLLQGAYGAPRVSHSLENGRTRRAPVGPPRA